MKASEHVLVTTNDEHNRTLISNIHPSSERSSHGYHLLTIRVRDDRASGHGFDPLQEAPVNRSVVILVLVLPSWIWPCRGHANIFYQFQTM